MSRILTAVLFLLALVPAATAQDQNVLHLTDGTTLEVDRILSETFTEVTFKRGSSEGSKPAEQVLAVTRDLSATALEDYKYGVELMDAGNFAVAYTIFEEVLQDDNLLKRSTYEWVKQHSLNRMARCQYSAGDMKGVSTTVQRLLSEVPDTFFYAPALMMEAQAKRVMGDRSGATAVYKRLSNDVASKGLPQRWEREAELGTILLDSSLKGKARTQALEGVAEKNVDQFPTVAARARVEVGNAMVESKDYAGARQRFEAILDEASVESSTLAAAISGLGDCNYKEALAQDDLAAQKPLLEAAILDFLTVASVYREEVILAPRAMYFAGDALKRYGDTSGAKSVASRLKKLYAKSPWTKRLFDELNLKM